MVNILIPEETPSHNKGEAAIFVGMMESFKLLEDNVKVSMFSFDPETDAANYGSKVNIIDAKGIMPSSLMFKSKGTAFKILEYLAFLIKHSSFFLLHKMLGDKATNLLRRDVWQYYCGADLVILAHDSAFSPLYHSVLIIFFKYLKKSVVVYGASLRPVAKSAPFFKRLLHNSLTKFVFCRTDLVTLREKMSYEYLGKMGADKTPFYLTGDLAFLVHPAPDERIKVIMKQEGIETSKPIIGMTVSKNKVNFAFSDIDEYNRKEEKFIEIMGNVIDYLTKSIDATVVFIPHSIVQDGERDDRVLAQKVLQVVVNTSRVKVIMSEYSSEELKGLTGKFDFCIGTRLHFIIDAVSMLVPSIALADKADFRIHGIIGEMLGQEKWVCNVEDLTSNELIAKIEKGWRLRDKTRGELQGAMVAIKKQTMLNGKLLSDLIKNSNASGSVRGESSNIRQVK